MTCVNSRTLNLARTRTRIAASAGIAISRGGRRGEDVLFLFNIAAQRPRDRYSDFAENPREFAVSEETARLRAHGSCSAGSSARVREDLASPLRSCPYLASNIVARAG